MYEEMSGRGESAVLSQHASLEPFRRRHADRLPRFEYLRFLHLAVSDGIPDVHTPDFVQQHQLLQSNTTVCDYSGVLGQLP